MKLFDSTFNSLQKAMDLTLKRHTVLAGNVANSETPNYRAREVDFSGELQKAIEGDTGELEKTNPMHMDLGGDTAAHIVFDNTSQMGADGNNVDLDIQTGKISQNAQQYSSAATYLSLKLKMIRQATARNGV